MFGHRADGKKVKNLEPIFRILPSVMIDRSDAQVYFKQDIPLSNMDEYIDKKAQDGIRMSYMNIIYAGIVRIINERPKLNRFVMNGTTYQRDTIYVSLSIKKSLTDDGQETVVKIPFKGTETILEIKEKVDATIEKNKDVQTANKTDNLVKILNLVPNFLILFSVKMLKFLDKHGIMPKAVIKASPFHTSVFLTNVGSLGIDSIYHHIYNFGTTSLFFSMGKIKSVTVPASVTHIGEQAIGYYPVDPDDPFSYPEVIPNFVIYGTSGTEAQTYADRNGIQFNSIASGTTVKGTAKSYLSADDTVTIQLEKSGVVVYETTVKGNSTDYSISGVANGTYTMRVSKKSHADREYTVKVSSADVTQNVEIFPIGDVNSDGDISVVDATLVQKYIVGLEKLTDLQKKSAEVNGDGEISVVDATLIQKYIVGLENFS